jgi:uncharacterized protein with HEPN domain
MPRDEDDVRLQHMLDYAREAIALSQGRARNDLDSDRLFNLGMTRLVEVIGESAARLSEPTRQAYPQIPWPQIVAARNRLIHGYDQINFDILWDIIEIDLPPLVAELEQILSRKEASS